MDFESAMQDLNREYTVAKDNVKFLNTLLRQFRNLEAEGIDGVEETIPQLMNGLRLIWIISRHFKKNDRMKDLIQTITEEISNKVQNHIQIDQLFKAKEGM